MRHAFRWTAPSPLWPELLPDAGSPLSSFAQPALLRFATDRFMEDFFALLERSPSGLRDTVAMEETWRGTVNRPALDAVLQPEGRLAARARDLKRMGASRQGLGSLPMTAAGIPDRVTDGTKPIKLYQPAHQRFYLVSASLVCQTSGFPDHRPDAGREERVGFVLRRLMPARPIPKTDALPATVDDTWVEYAYVQTARGPGWRRIDAARRSAATLVPEAVQSLLPGEEVLPMFSAGSVEDSGRRRSVFAGLVPVGRREAYLGAPEQVVPDEATLEPGAGSTRRVGPKTARMALFRTQVAEPWKRLLEIAARVRDDSAESRKDGSADAQYAADTAVKLAREQIQVSSWLVLMEFAKYLEQYAKDVWDGLASASAPAAHDDAEDRLDAALRRTVYTDPQAATLAGPGYASSAVKRSLRDALLALKTDGSLQPMEDQLDRATATYDRNTPSADWPGFLFPLADPDASLEWKAVATPETVPDLESADGVGPEDDPLPRELREPTGNALRDVLESVDALVALVVRALPATTTQPVPALPLAAQPLLDHRDGVFVIRCAYARPRCGTLHDDVLSAPTQPFRLANFFDPDAPARPIRIAMPLDTSPAGMRKFNKNTAFMISDVLCGQVQRAKSLGLVDLVRSVLPFPLHKDLPSIDTSPCTSRDPALQMGMMCSLSIPIITVCAFILLMIMVSLLDIVFRWIPWFITCFPIPGLKGKAQ